MLSSTSHIRLSTRSNLVLLLPLAFLLLVSVAESNSLAGRSRRLAHGRDSWKQQHPLQASQRRSVAETDNTDASSSSAPAPAPAPLDLEAMTACAQDPLCGNPASVEWFQAHGWLMWMAFGVFMPLGIITSRHLQSATRAWFYIHIACMTLAVACVVAGGSIAFAKFEAIPETPPDDPAYVHVTLGTAVFIMACLNFLLGLGRPHKGQALRPVWYLFHFTFGTLAVVLAWYVIYTGMNLYEEAWVIETGSGLPDLHVLKDLFAVNIAVVAYIYLLMGRWEHMMKQQHEEDAK